MMLGKDANWIYSQYFVHNIVSLKVIMVSVSFSQIISGSNHRYLLGIIYYSLIIRASTVERLCSYLLDVHLSSSSSGSAREPTFKYFIIAVIPGGVLLCGCTPRRLVFPVFTISWPLENLHISPLVTEYQSFLMSPTSRRAPWIGGPRYQSIL